jgi:hypothetical protein
MIREVPTDKLLFMQEFFNELANSSRRKFLDIQTELERREKGEGYDWKQDAEQSYQLAITLQQGILADLEANGAPR